MILPELVDNCNLSCTLCINRFRKPTGKQMSIETVQQVLKKYRGHMIDWFNWGEPLLHKQFLEISSLMGGTYSRLSTNLSLPLTDEYISAMRRFKVVIVSLSGMTGETYKIYHTKGNFELVMENLERLLNIRRSPKDTIINWLWHKYNEHEYPRAEQYCKERRIRLHPLKLVCTVEELVNNFDHELLVTPRYQSTRRQDCRILYWTPIDVDGDYVLCCTSQNIKIGYSVYEDVSPQDLVQAKMKTALCTECRERELWRMYS